jgi:hypothetical protein
MNDNARRQDMKAVKATNDTHEDNTEQHKTTQDKKSHVLVQHLSVPP